MSLPTPTFSCDCCSNENCHQNLPGFTTASTRVIDAVIQNYPNLLHEILSDSNPQLRKALTEIVIPLHKQETHEGKVREICHMFPLMHASIALGTYDVLSVLIEHNPDVAEKSSFAIDKTENEEKKIPPRDLPRYRIWDIPGADEVFAMCENASKVSRANYCNEN